MWPLFVLTRFNVQVNVIHIMGPIESNIEKKYTKQNANNQ